MTTARMHTSAVWDDMAHFRPGERVVVAPISGSFHGTEVLYRIVSIEARTLKVLGIAARETHTGMRFSSSLRFVEVPERTPVRLEEFTRLRHVEGCPACVAYVNGVRVLAQEQEHDHLSQWCAAAHERFASVSAQIDWGTASFGPDADVPEWLREVTRGRLVYPEGPDLQLARLYDRRIDWPRLIAEHPGDLPVRIGEDGYGHPGLTWSMVVEAHSILEAAGCQPYMDVDLAYDEQGNLALYPTILYITEPADAPTAARVDAVLTGYPFVDMHPGWSFCE